MGRTISGLGFFCLLGCATFSSPRVDIVMLNHNAPIRTHKNVEVALAMPENREYVTVAIIEGEGKSTRHSYSDVVNEMKKRAGELGVDMLVLTSPTPVAARNVLGLYSNFKQSVNVKGVAICFVKTTTHSR